MTEPVDDVSVQLRARGLRSTVARRAVLEVLAHSPQHLSADEVAEQVHAFDPGLHLSTVYRTLDALERAGVVRHVHFGHGRATYHLTAGEHPHAACAVCGRIIELEPDELAGLSDHLAAEHDFVLDTHFALSGRCSACRQPT